VFPHYSAVGEETKRSFPPLDHEGPFFGGVFPLKIKHKKDPGARGQVESAGKNRQRVRGESPPHSKG